MQTFVPVSSTHANSRPAPLFSSRKCMKGFFPQGGGGHIYYHEGGGTSKASVSSATQSSLEGI